MLLFACALSLMAQDTAPSDTSQAGEEYGGPAILSRGEIPGAPTTAPITFRPYIGLNGIYDSGLVPDSVNSQGHIPTLDLFGVELNLGLYGYHVWKHTSLALDYKGDFRHYANNSSYDGSDQFLSLILRHEPNKHVEFILRETAGYYSQGYFLGSAQNILDATSPQIPQNDLYDTPVIFLTTAADMIYRKSTRLSFDLGGEGYLVRRQSSDLYGLTGYDAHGDVQYRASRHTTIGADYRFTHYEYTKGFGTTDIHSVGFDYSTRLARHVQLSARIGGARVESSSLEQVPLAPAVAAILGISVGIQASYQLHYVPDIEARLVDSFQHSELTLTYTNDVNPGNGVYLTSKMESGMVSYHYTGVRHWNIGADASYTQLSVLTQTFGAYTWYGAGAGCTRELGKGLHAVSRFDARRYSIAAVTQYRGTEYRVMLGLTFSPGNVPLALW